MRTLICITIGLLLTGISLNHCASFKPPEEKAPSYESVKQLYEQGEYSQVIYHADSLLNESQGSPVLQYYLGLAYLKERSVDNAMDAYHTAADSQQNPDMDSAYAAELAQWAMQLYENNEYEAVLAVAQRAISIQETNTTAHYAKFMAEGRQLLEQGNRWELWDAIVAFGNAAELAPDKPMPHYYLAQAYRKKDDKDFTNIISECEAALRRDPPPGLREEIQKQLKEARRRKNLYEDFWGQ